MAGRIPVVYNKAYKAQGIKSYVYALNKYGFAPTVPGLYKRDATQNKLIKTLADGTSHAVGAADQQNDSFYTCSVQIGTPAQTVQLDFDSGSSDLWVKTPTTATGAGAKTGTFDSAKSTTFKTTEGSTWNMSYGDGSSASGTVGTDTVKIGDISIKNQAVEVATKLSSEFQTEASSGLLGLAFGTINTVKPTPVKTPVENMIAQTDIDKSAELFTCYLGSEADGTSKDGFYTFGSIDQTLVKQSGQDISYVPIDNSKGFWAFTADTVTIGGKSIQQPSGNQAIADTGTTLMMVNDQFCKALYAQIQGAKLDQQQQGYVFPKTATLPEVVVNVGNAKITIEKDQLAFQDLSDGYVYGGIQSSGTLGMDIWGDIFLKNVYAVFDVGNKQFGVVQRPSASGSTSGAGQ